MPYKISGSTSDDGRIIVSKESDWEVEKTAEVTSPSYEVTGVTNDKKLVTLIKTDGQLLSYGYIDPVQYGFFTREMTNSIVLDDDDSGYLYRTASTPSDSKKCIISLWHKRNDLGYSCLIGEYVNSSNRFGMFFDVSPQKISIIQVESGIGEIVVTATPYFRDTTGWYNIVLAIDTTQPTEADRVKLFINGEEQPFQTYTCTQNVDVRLLVDSLVQNVGRSPQNGGTLDYCDGYLGEVIVLDGQTSSDPASLFGEFKEGIWVPKEDISGLTYGNNGFNLDFSNANDLGNDVSGKNNDFSLSNITSANQVLDGSTNNYAVMNFVDKTWNVPQPEYQDGGLTLVGGSSQTKSARSSLFMTEGKWYAECEISTGLLVEFGLAAGIWQGNVPANFSWMLSNRSTGLKAYDENSNVSVTTERSSGTVMQCAVDMDNSRAWVGYDNNWIDSSGGLTGNPATGANPTFTSLPAELAFAIEVYNSTGYVNFGQKDFQKTQPTGFNKLAASYLTTPTVVDPTEGIYIGTRAGIGKVVTNAGVTHSTTQAKFGTSSMYFNGSSSLSLADSDDWEFGNGDFTVDWWERRDDNVFSASTIARDKTTAYSFLFGLKSGSTRYVYMSSDGASFDIANAKTLGSIEFGVWTHLAVVRNGDTFYLFKNGNQTDSWSLGSSLSIFPNSNPLSIGTSQVGHYFAGYIDEIRISKGIARYTTDFTPPTRFNSRDSYTKLLLQSINIPNGNTWGVQDIDFITDINFSPAAGAMAIVKSTDNVSSWILGDTERNPNQTLWVDLAIAEGDNYWKHYAEFMPSSGVRLGCGNSVNVEGRNYLDIVLRDDPTYGFDIKTWTGTGANLNLAHDLNLPPTMVWLKNRIDATDWVVYHNYSDETKDRYEYSDYYLYLSTNAARAAADSSIFQDKAPDEDYVYLGSNNLVNGNTDAMMAYMFTDIPGYCKAFQYRGAGDADGPYINLGFKPGLILIKGFDAGFLWALFDNISNPFNPTTKKLTLDTNVVQDTSAQNNIDFMSQGFKVRANNIPTNTNGYQYLGFAWAAEPGTYSTAK